MKKKKTSRNRVEHDVRFQDIKMPTTFRRLRREYLSEDIESRAHIKSRDRFLRSLGVKSTQDDLDLSTDLRKRVLASLTDTELVQDMRFVCSKHRDEIERCLPDREEELKNMYRFADSFTSALKAATASSKKKDATIEQNEEEEAFCRLKDPVTRENVQKIVQQRRDRFRHTERQSPMSFKDAKNTMQSFRYDFENRVLGPCLLDAIRGLKESKSHNDVDVLRVVRAAHSSLSCRTKRRGGIPTQCSVLPNTSDLQSLMKRCQKS